MLLLNFASLLSESRTATIRAAARLAAQVAADKTARRHGGVAAPHEHRRTDRLDHYFDHYIGCPPGATRCCV